jgi:hypothetical protein
MRTSSLISITPLALLGVLAAVVIAVIFWPSDAEGAQRFVATTGADAGACNPAPCQSFGYAYRQSAPGDVVEVAAGSYGGQTIPLVAGRTGPAVEFRPATGAKVALGGLNLRGGFVTVRDMVTGWLDIDGSPNGGSSGAPPLQSAAVINGSGGGIWIRNVDNLLIQGGAYGPIVDKPLVQIGAEPTSRNIVFDGVDFHDATASGDGVHMECMWAGSTIGLTVRNSIFRNCSHFDIFFTRDTGDNVSNVLLENNVFEAPKQPNGQDAPYALNISNWLTRMDGYVIRNNAFGADITIQPTSISNSRIVNNIGPIASCESGVVYSHNIFTSRKCSSSDRPLSSVMSQFVNPAAHDWHLKPGAAAIDFADPTDSPTTDRDGFARDVGPPDAGAYEFGAGPKSGVPPAPAPATAPKILSARLSKRTICVLRTRRCRAASTRLAVRLDAPAKLTTRLQRVNSRRKTRTVRSYGRAAQKTGVTVFVSVRGRGLKRGRYRLRVFAVGASGRRSKAVTRALRVR